MNDLIEIYRRIEYLRNNGLKMKEIADYVDMASQCLVCSLFQRSAHLCNLIETRTF